MTGPNSALTIVALAWHEAEQLQPCFESLRHLIDLANAKTLIVLDDTADEATRVAAHKVSTRVVEAPFVTFSAQRNLALGLADTEWVFFIDPDERCTRPMAEEIKRAIMGEDCAAYRVPRRNFLFGREVRHTGWWPDYQIRLLRRRLVRYEESRKVHEFPEVEGEICTLLNPLIHYNYKSWEQFVQKQLAYAPLEAQALYEMGTRARLRNFVGQPLRELKRRYIDYEGYRDGLMGIALSVAMAAYRLETYRRLRRIELGEPE